MQDHYVTIGSKRYSNEALSSHLESEITTLNKRLHHFRGLIGKDTEILRQFEDMVKDRQNILDWLNREDFTE